MLRIGVLALQGSVVEHLHLLSKIEGVQAFEVKSAANLEDLDGLIIPGGESTTIGKLLRDFNIKDPITDKLKNGMPVWGTCAGMILLAKEILNEDQVHLGLMDISVRRNAYGSQLDSFSTKVAIPKVSNDEIPLVFIRAPWVEKVSGDAEVLAELDGRIIAVRQNNMLATSFHPELTNNTAFHNYFADMVRRAK